MALLYSWMYNQKYIMYIKYNDFDKYPFTKNLQGDIIEIYKEDGTKVASYSYDAWGNHTVTNYTSDNIGDINPFRYRGYYFDSETNFYYLNSRYYDPEIKRFISADSIDIIGTTPDGLTDKNLYAYCDNNPVMREDEDGKLWLKILLGAAKGVVKQAVSDIVTYVTTGTVDTSVSKYIGVAVGGAVGELVPKGMARDIVTKAVETTITLVCDNIGVLVTGKGEWHSDLELFDTVAYDTISTAVTSFTKSKIKTSNEFFNFGMGKIIDKAESSFRKDWLELMSFSW